MLLKKKIFRDAKTFLHNMFALWKLGLKQINLKQVLCNNENNIYNDVNNNFTALFMAKRIVSAVRFCYFCHPSVGCPQ